MPLTAILFALTAAAAPVGFNRDIRPIMADTCFRCHGPDKGSRMANLRLDIREEALKTRRNGIPIAPGDPDKSLIIQRIFANDARIMPPEAAHRTLTPAQKDTVRRWVAEGAKYEGHWAYQPITKPVPPKAAGNPIDAFIEDRLNKEGLKPSLEADRRTLLRRVTLDLTGLPPTPEDLAAFTKDKSPDAYEHVVDRLLASPAYAEKQTMHWLDAVRYADTCGFHSDNPFPAWPYRDYVLKAFRDNKPFDQFTREQLAGDLLPGDNVENKVASAYNRMSRTSAEGGLQPVEYLAKYGADRVRTTATVWLGSTLGCAECHDHKFDPFASRDFYAMKAFFADIKETGLVPDQGPKAWGSQVSLPTEEQTAKREDLQARIKEAKQRLAANLSPDAGWEAELLRRHKADELAWKFQKPSTALSRFGATLTVKDDYINASGKNPDNDTFTIELTPGAGDWAALGLDVGEDEELVGGGIARGADRFVITEVEAESPQGQKLDFSLATSGLIDPPPGMPAMAAIDGNAKTGWGALGRQDHKGLFLALRFREKLHTLPDSVITVRIHHDSTYRRAVIGHFRLGLSPVEYAWPATGKNKISGLPDAIVTALNATPDKRTPEQQDALLAHRAWMAPSSTSDLAALAKLEAELDLLNAEIPTVVVSESVTPRETRILARGNWMDETGAIVDPAIPGFLGKLETNGQRATRLDLANWIVSPNNPLTARVQVNRLWREFFGTGITKTLDDLGSQGELPTHLELLDWLASEFKENWDTKHIIRLIVTSHTYRQSSDTNAQLDERDPDNRLLARQNRMRVDAEVVHDIALSVSGLLKSRFGGPSVRPYEPEGYLAALNFPRREYSASRGDDLYRRGIYTQWQRTFLHPSTAIFDAPSREECTVNRSNSNTPLQSLVLLNDPIYVEAARAFAAEALESGAHTFDSQLDWAYDRALNRKPTSEERRILSTLYKKSLTRYSVSHDNASDLIHAGESAVPSNLPMPQFASFTIVTRAILNLHETITRY